jgi:Zn finger protein HypA/HybF involved in hydrogenase expression
MNKLKVKKESLAKRCEICHQKDSFDDVANYCFRCKEAETLVKLDDQVFFLRKRNRN